MTIKEEPVPSLAISNSDMMSSFSYSPPMSRDTDRNDRNATLMFTGPRTVLTLLSSATASLGNILPISSPHNRSSYSVQFYGPIVSCSDADNITAGTIQGLLQQNMNTPRDGAVEVENAYYGFVAGFNQTGGRTAISQPRYQSYSNATNQLWMTFLRYSLALNGTRIRNRMYQVCRLHNASFDLQLEWNHGFQNVTADYEILEEIPYPNDQLGVGSKRTHHSYSAFFWSLTDQLVGRLGWLNDLDGQTIGRAPQYGVIETAIQHTSVLGSSDLDSFFDFDVERGLYRSDNETTISGQRLQDKFMAGNRTLQVLIEELSKNTTISLLHNTLLT